MKKRPILFFTPMVQAILDGRKTMTRRVLKPQPKTIHTGKKNEKHYVAVVDLKNGEAADPGSPAHMEECPYGIPGDHLWVREAFCIDKMDDDCGDGRPFYKASEEHPEIFPKWKPSIFMPRWASRITLEITNVRVERLLDITGSDAIKEGWPKNQELYPHINTEYKALLWFENLWDSINGKKYPWSSDPWVWVIEFKKA